MTTTPQQLKYICIKEDKLAELDAEINFKQKRLNDIDHKIEKMDEKIDKLNNSINQLILKSQQDDNLIEQRIIALETKINENEEHYRRVVTAITVLFTILTFALNYIKF